ncbi:MAG: tetratricopeptide repeat protein [Alphaproteobacteria bacterium]|nr:tetratricopeptide repeat protein [Alphaproteobacteria bacterium]
MPSFRKWAGRVLPRMASVLLVATLPAACVSRVHHPAEPSAAPSEQTQVEKVVPGKESVAGAYLAGRHAQTERDFGAAADFYTRALEDDPNNVDLLRRAYALLAAEGDIDKAVAMVNRLMALKEDSPMAPLVVSIKDIRANNFAKVEQELGPVPRHGLNSFLVPLIIAWAQVGQNHTDAALKTLESLANAEHLQTLYHFHAGLINDLADRTEAARANYQKVLKSEGDLSLRAVEVVGSFHLRHGEPEKARALVNRYLSEHPETLLLDGLVKELGSGTPGPRPINSAREGIAESLFGAATSIREGNALDSALLFARLALAVQPDFPLTQVLVGDILQSQGRFEDANVAYNAIKPDASAYYSTQLRVADNLKRMNNSEAAIKVLRNLADRRPDRPDALIDLGDVLRADKHFPEAVTAYDQAFSRIKVIEPRHWALYYSRGIALERAKEWKLAEKDFLTALELDPNQPYVLNYLGYSWLEQKINVDKARGMIRKAVELRPEDGYIVDSLGWSEFMVGEYDAAVHDIERAVELQPEDPVINEHLGDAYWRVGRRTEARYQWQRSLGFEPDADQIEGLKAKLDHGMPPLAANGGPQVAPTTTNAKTPERK